MVLAINSSFAEDYVINIVEATISEERKAIVEQYYIDIYKQVNIKPTFTYLPSLRGLSMVNRGEINA